jgi:alcohol dehydrogenase class IV
MDAAKAMAAVAGNRARAVDFLGLNRVPGPGLPRSWSPPRRDGKRSDLHRRLHPKDLKKKEGMNSPYLYPDVALLDPLLTVGLPPWRRRRREWTPFATPSNPTRR